MKLEINGTEVPVTWENNEAASALQPLVRLGSIEIHASRYANVEQLGQLPCSLPTNDQQRHTNPGEIMLYQGTQIVLFFGKHSWSYTKLGEITGLDETRIRELLDHRKIRVKIAP